MNVFKKFAKLFSVRWSELMPLLTQMHKDSGRSKRCLFRDMLRCYELRGINWGNYAIAGFHLNQDPIYRASFLSQAEMAKLRKLYNSPEAIDILEDKGKALRFFGDLIKRDFCDLRVNDFHAFQAFVAENKRFFTKPPMAYGGEGVQCHERDEIGCLEKFHQKLMRDKHYVVEAAIKQHPEMSKLSLCAVNSLRILTCINRAGEVSIPYDAVRIALTDACCDNASMGGAFAVLDDEGRIPAPLMRYLPYIQTYAENPETHFSYLGFTVPRFTEAKAFAIRLAKRIPNARIVGWDIAITAEGVDMIEANTNPSPDLGQAFVSIPHDCGVRVAVLTALGETL